ncbi:hypothetical protein Q5752_003176 [Cryptotrichosporon argae]
MTLRNASGKFSLPFGRKGPNDAPVSPSSRQPSGTYAADDSDPSSPIGNGGSGGGGLNTAAFDGLGKKIGKSIAHTSLLPGLGNKDLRALQDVITAEKGVLQAAERLGAETSTVAAKLPVYGQQEGPDLQDVLTHSSTLLSHLSTAFHVFAEHQTSLRATYKRIREREEELEELRRRRRATGQKAETAEKKLAKMGPENKGLPQQTELLDRLRSDMRSMDTDIITEESKLGDYKRQTVKEALWYKFGGLEELGEKMCIIGELGKLLLEEIPLEETPPGYGRAPYSGYERTENTINEATKCLATVRFQAGSSAPKPPGLPNLKAPGALRTPDLSRHTRTLSEAEQYAHYPGNVASPSHGSVPLGTDPSNGAGAYPLDANPYGSTSGVVWQQPEDGEGPAYEYEQQREIEAAQAREEAAWREQQDHEADAGLAPAVDIHASEVTDPQLAAQSSIDARPWEPLNVRKTPEPPASITLHDGPLPAAKPSPPAIGGYSPPATDGYTPPPPPAPISLAAPVRAPTNEAYDAYAGIEETTSPVAMSAKEHAPPMHIPLPSPAPPTPAGEAFYTPSGTLSENSTPNMVHSAAAVFPLPDVVPRGNGKMSAAAFRRGVKPRTSTESADLSSPPQPPYERESTASPAGSSVTGHQIRRLPVPPLERSASAQPNDKTEEEVKGQAEQRGDEHPAPPAYQDDAEDLR